MLHQYFRRTWGLTPIASAIAYSLARRDDDDAHAIACWWIACKFDTGQTVPSSDLIHDLPILGTRGALLAAEGDVLVRAGFFIDRNTIVQRIHDHLPPDAGSAYDEWLHFLLSRGLLRLLDPEEWARVLRNLLNRVYLPVVIQVISYSLNRREKRRLVVPPCVPRLVHKRPRFV